MPISESVCVQPSMLTYLAPVQFDCGLEVRTEWVSLKPSGQADKAPPSPTPPPPAQTYFSREVAEGEAKLCSCNLQIAFLKKNTFQCCGNLR